MNYVVQAHNVWMLSAMSQDRNFPFDSHFGGRLLDLAFVQDFHCHFVTSDGVGGESHLKNVAVEESTNLNRGVQCNAAMVLVQQRGKFLLRHHD